MSFLDRWVAHSMNSDGRHHLEDTDKIWEELYLKSHQSQEFKDTHVQKGTLLFRVHSAAGKKPKLSDYDDMDNAEEVFNHETSLWKKRRDINAIKWDNHWVSFTPNLDVIGSHYFADKGLRGFVIVIKSDKAINISENNSIKFDEYEIVAPMDSSTCVEILNFNDFIDKYGTGKSDYENT